MKTLVIDNYDSFTHNLVHLIADINQEDPLVVTNDAMGWDELSSLDFDNIVISPGPGRPDRAGDFGLCAQAIAQSCKPLLGVCLGHQGIAMADGATLSPAPSLVHGRTSNIFHHGHPLFAGIPSPFTAARYHSFIVGDPLPEHLERIAWTDDGLTMGIARRNRLQWGVQFHPESILSEHGRRLLQNFRDITRDHIKPARSFSSQPRGRTAHTPVVISQTKRAFWRELPRVIDAEAIFDALYATSPHAFWLDSSLRDALADPSLARWSYLGDASGPHARTLRYRRLDNSIQISDAAGERTVQADIFDYLKNDPVSRAQHAPPCPFTGGKIGWFGYESRQESTRSASTPDAFLIEADRFIAIDHFESKTYLCALDDLSESARAEAWLAQTQAKIGKLVPLAPPTADGSVSKQPLTFRLDHGKTTYLAHIQQCLDLIAQGESYQVCLTNELTCDSELDPFDLYRCLRRINPAPFAAFIRYPLGAVLSASPERFLSADPKGHVETKPIKGTIRRDGDSQRDRDLVASLKASEKDRAENAMIVDLLRNDLSRSCEPGSVVVPKLFDIETYQTVHQLVSTVRGRLKSDRTVIDLLREAFPGGSMVGAPKHRTLEIIDALEQRARGIYSGTLGWIGDDGAAELSIVIRAIVAQKERLSIGVGGGIVAASTPSGEFDEMLLKARASITAIVTASFGRFDETLFSIEM